MNAFQRQIEEFKKRGASLVLVSPTMPDQSLSMVEKNNLTFDVLSDVGNVVGKEYGLVFSLEPKIREIYKGLEINVPEFNGGRQLGITGPSRLCDRSG